MRNIGKIAAVFAALCVMLTLPVGCSDDKKPTPGGGEETYNIKCNKTEYADGEEVYVSAKGDGDDWVGVYRDGDDIQKVEPVRYYSVARNGFISGETYALKKSAAIGASRQAMKNLPRGKYYAVLFDGTGTGKQTERISFTVKKDKLKAPSAPLSVKYELENAADGLADGKLTLYFDKNACAEEVVMYWADADGALDGYAALAIFPVYGDKAEFDMYANTIIPAEATRIIAYAKNGAGVSEKYRSADLPEGSQFVVGEPALAEFSVVSDVHITVAYEHIANTAINQQELHDAHFNAMLNDVKTVSPQSGGVFIVGDIANAGYESEWKHAQELVDASGVDVFYTLGNHDLYGGAYADKAQVFKAYAKTEKVYYEKVIDGYHHLALGSESTSNGLDANLSDAQLSWLDGRLKSITESEPNKPVFLYLHQSLYNTVAGSFPGQDWDGVAQDDALRAIIRKYKQVYMFNGHSHWDLNTRGSMHDRSDGLPNIFNTASVGYLWSSMYVPTGEYLKGSQGYHIRVYADKTLVLGRDFENSLWLPSACFCASI